MVQVSNHYLKKLLEEAETQQYYGHTKTHGRMMEGKTICPPLLGGGGGEGRGRRWGGGGEHKKRVQIIFSTLFYKAGDLKYT